MSYQCMICLCTKPIDRWYSCCIMCKDGYMCEECYIYIKNNDIELPSYFHRTISGTIYFRCSLNCLVNTTIYYYGANTEIEKKFINSQQNLLQFIYTKTALINYLYKDLINIVNEYIS